MKKEYYLNLRNLYQPNKLRCIFILESPPASGLYFYDKNGKTSEPLFAELMKFLKISVDTKSEGLKHFAKSGYLLVDATYQPVNELKGEKRNKAILNNFDNLIEDLERINPEKTTPLILIKANICKLLEQKLKQKGFNVLNNNIVVPFPSTGQQKRFQAEINKFKLC